MVVRRPSCKNLIIRRISISIKLAFQQEHWRNEASGCRGPAAKEISLKMPKLLLLWFVFNKIFSVHERFVSMALDPVWVAPIMLTEQRACLLYHCDAGTNPPAGTSVVSRWRTTRYTSHFSVQGPGNFLRERRTVSLRDRTRLGQYAQRIRCYQVISKEK